MSRYTPETCLEREWRTPGIEIWPHHRSRIGISMLWLFEEKFWPSSSCVI